MPLDKKRRLGRTVEEMRSGEQLTFSRTVEDKDLLLYLGLTDDNNPLFIQHDYASLTPYEKPVVPSVMLTGMITGAVSKILPGPGSYVLSQNLEFPNPTYHYGTVNFFMEVDIIDTSSNEVTLNVEAKNEDEDVVLTGSLKVAPPYKPKSLTESAFDNFS